MRDINRIDSLLAKLGEAWKKTPDQRFGQFLYNFLMAYGKDPFYAEDDEWMAGIQAYIDGRDIAQAMEEYRKTKTDHFTFNLDEIMDAVRKTLQESAEKYEKTSENTEE